MICSSRNHLELLVIPLNGEEQFIIDDARQFCFDDAEFVTSNVMIQENNIKVIVEQNDYDFLPISRKPIK